MNRDKAFQMRAGTLADPEMKPRKAPVRKLFAHVTREINGKLIRFEQHKDGLHIRRKHSPKVTVLTFHDLYFVSTGQSLLPLR